VNFILRHTRGMSDDVDPDPRGKVYHVLRGGLNNCRVTFEKTGKGRVVFLGGSITEHGAWRGMTAKALARRFPKAKLTFVNAGISSVDSTGDAFRFRRDVLAGGKVDLLLIDASVNDYHNRRTHTERIRAMEGIVRAARKANPAVDIVVLCFADASFMRDRPPVIVDHLRVASHYQTVSVDLAREVFARIESGEFQWKLFRDCHPSPFGHRLYAASLERLFDKAWKGPVPKAAKVIPHSLPKPLDDKNYAHARLVDIGRAKLGNGWKLVKRWVPKDRAGTRPRFVRVPAAVAEQPDSELTFAFEGTAVGLFITAGPDAGIIQYSIDGSKPKTVDTFTAWSGGLHLPWALTLDAKLEPGKHTLELRTTNKKNPRSKGHACRIMHFMVN